MRRGDLSYGCRQDPWVPRGRDHLLMHSERFVPYANLFSALRYARRSAHNEVCGHQDLFLLHLLFFYELYKLLRGNHPHGLLVDVDRSQRRIPLSRDVDVVETDHAEIVGNAETGMLDRVHGAYGDEVVVRNHRARRLFHPQERVHAAEALVDPASTVSDHQVRMGGQPVCGYRLLESEQPLPGGGLHLLTRKIANAPVAQRHQMLARLQDAVRVVDQHGGDVLRGDVVVDQDHGHLEAPELQPEVVVPDAHHDHAREAAEAKVDFREAECG